MDRVELYMKLGELPPLGSFEDYTLREFLVNDRSRRVAKTKLQAFMGANSENLSELNKYLKTYINAEHRIEDFVADRDLKLREEFAMLQGTDLKASLGTDGVLQVSGFEQ